MCFLAQRQKIQARELKLRVQEQVSCIQQIRQLIESSDEQVCHSNHICQKEMDFFGKKTELNTNERN